VSKDAALGRVQRRKSPESILADLFVAQSVVQYYSSTSSSNHVVTIRMGHGCVKVPTTSTTARMPRQVQ
jgi:hypothetical protein